MTDHLRSLGAVEIRQVRYLSLLDGVLAGAAVGAGAVAAGATAAGGAGASSPSFASDRKRLGWGQSVSVRVDLGVRLIFKKHTNFSRTINATTNKGTQVY